MGRKAWLVGVVCAGWLVGCSSSKAKPGGVDSSCSSAQVGPAGATLSHRAGATLTIPAGALTTPTQLSLCGQAAPTSAQLQATPLAQAFSIAPVGLTLQQPATLVLPFDPSKLPSGLGAQVVQLRTSASAGAGGSFAALQSTVDVAHGRVTARVTTLGDFVPAANPNPTFITTMLPAATTATVGVPFSQSFSATGGTPPYHWSIPANAPPGLSMSDDGTLSGTPTSAGSFAFFVAVADSGSNVVQLAMALTVVAAASPLPSVSDVIPASLPVTTIDTQVTIDGSDFVAGSAVEIGGQGLSTDFVSSSELLAIIPASYLSSAGTIALAVYTPPPGGGTSSGTVTLTVVGTSAPPDMAVGGMAGGGGSSGGGDMSMSSCPSGQYLCTIPTAGSSGSSSYCTQIGNCCGVTASTPSMCPSGDACGSYCHCPSGSKFCNGDCIPCGQSCSAIPGSRVGCCSNGDCLDAGFTTCFTTSLCN